MPVCHMHRYSDSELVLVNYFDGKTNTLKEDWAGLKMMVSALIVHLAVVQSIK